MAYEVKSGSEAGLNKMLGYDPDPTERKIAEYRELKKAFGKIDKDYEKDISRYRKKLQEDELKERKRELKRMDEESQSGWKKAFKSAGELLVNSLKSAISSIDSYIQSYTQYMGKVTTRLQGTGLTYTNLIKDVSKNLAVSPYLKQTDMISNLNKFVESGIAYNVESRAYIATATDKIATTFNAFDSSLLRIIRIQQADSTVARIGMESLLTKFLNARYEDTSYLSNSARSVTGLLTEAESLMGYKGATEFEYAVQSWLGSMSALGVSENTIQALATGLGYLGSGNISALSGNTALQNLLVMAASNAGLNYGSLLTGGLDARTANALLSNIVGIGQNIATSGNNVVRSQYAQLFGLSVSDLVSLTNITANDLRAISQNIVNYETLRQETTNQLRTMGERTTMSEKVQNVLSNYLTTMGMNVADNPALYALWSIAGLMSSSGLDPTINLGFLGTGTSTSTSTLLKLGVVGTSALLSLGNAIGSIAGGNAGGTNITAWGEREVRGTGLAVTGLGTTSLSSSSYIGSLDASNMNQGVQTLKEETATYTGEQEEDKLTRTVVDLMQPDLHEIYMILNKWDVNNVFTRAY